LSIYALGGIARDAGIEVEVMDPSRYGLRIRQRRVVEELIRGYDAVGISATSLTWHEAFRLIENIKSINESINVIVGGVHATYFDEHILRNTKADYVVRGEAERTFPMLLKAMEQGREPKDIPGVSYRSVGNDIVRNPLEVAPRLENGSRPLYEAIPDRTYKMFPLETSRGCPNSCFFCSIPHRKRWRPRDPAKVMAELETINRSFMMKTLGNIVLVVDDCFTASERHVQEICSGIKERGYPNSFVLEARITDLLKEPIISSLAGLNLTTIQVGVECGYDEGLTKVNKSGLTISKVLKGAKLLKDYGIVDKVMFSLILGLPWEGEEECLRTLDFAAALVSQYGGYVNFSWWILFPSNGWDQRQQYGIDVDEDLFDIQDWVTLEELFYATHPRISAEFVQVVKQRIGALREKGYALYGI
jgi:radical SAM superfamily enzyme YgiQ (UPF0313 family)